MSDFARRMCTNLWYLLGMDHDTKFRLNQIEGKLDRLFSVLRIDQHGRKDIMALIDDISADVASNTSAVGSAVTLLQNLSAALAAAGTDPVKLQAIKDTLEKNTADLAAAVTANTPAAPSS